MSPLVFPSYNLYSMLLIVLVIQGYVFALLLSVRFLKLGKKRDLLLAIFLFITGYHRTTFIIGFMDWYDTFRNTKVNYYLINLILAVGPLIYFYVKSAINPLFRFKRKDIWHFIPAAIYIIYSLFIWIHDMGQPGYDGVQNGEWKVELDFKYFSSIFGYLNFISLLLYLIFTGRLFYEYRSKINQYYSNTYKAELNWLRNFLVIYIFLFVFDTAMLYVDDNIMNLHWKQRWWTHFASACVMVYLGVYGYFTDLSGLENIIDSTIPAKKPISLPNTEIDTTRLDEISSFMEREKPFLDPDLTLVSLSNKMNTSSQELSSLINKGLNKNFNDFINSYRVETVKEKIKGGRAEQLSLLGIAYESGFNSKATFNRTFKKLAKQSPSEFLKSVR